MAANQNRLSSFSNVSAARVAPQQATQVSTTTILNNLHTAYTSGVPYQLDSSTSLTVNTWLTATTVREDGSIGGTVDPELARKAWEHARRRAEDGCIVLGSLHQGTPSLLTPFIQSLPLAIPSIYHTAVAAISPFLKCVTPYNPSASRHSALAVSFTLTLTGELNGVSLALSSSGLDTTAGLLGVPAEPGYRAFDVFYYLLTSASTPAEREFLGLKSASSYALLNRTSTFEPPTYLPAADDTAAAEDFRSALKAIGIKGATHRDLISTLAGLLKLGDMLGFMIDEEVLDDICEDVGGLLGVDPEVLVKKCTTDERGILIASIYEAVVDWVISKANAAIAAELKPTKDAGSSGSSGPHSPGLEGNDADIVSLTVVDVPNQELGRAVGLRGVFDDTTGINAEMKRDGVEIVSAGASVIKEMNSAVYGVAADLGISSGPMSNERDYEHDRRQSILEKVGVEVEDDGFVKKILYPIEGDGISIGKHGRFDLPALLASTRVWYHLDVHPTDDAPATLATLASQTYAWSAGTVSRQLRAWRLPEWANRRNRHMDFTADFDVEEFCSRYSVLGCSEGKDGVENWILERGWSNGEVVIGEERIWMRENAWWEAETMLDVKSMNPFNDGSGMGGYNSGYSAQTPGNGSGFFPPMGEGMIPGESTDNLLNRQQSSATAARSAMGGARSVAPTVARTINTAAGGDYGLGPKGDDTHGVTYYGELDPEMGDPKSVTEKPITKGRKAWVAFTWACTWWIPSFLLRHIGRMKRPDVRQAWREKLALMMLIFLLNATIVFYIIEFGNLLCPDSDKAWNNKEVSEHQGTNDFYVSIHGKVYDITKFWKLQHSDTDIDTTTSNMSPFMGENMDGYFPPPLIIACPGLVTSKTMELESNKTLTYSNAEHVSGYYATDTTSKLAETHWYTKRFLPKIKQYHKGDLVWTKSYVYKQGQAGYHDWVIIDDKIYDLTDYYYTLDLEDDLSSYSWLPDDVSEVIKNNPGEDVTSKWKKTANFTNALNCMENAFYVGRVDFRDSIKCQFNNYLLLAFTIILCAVILIKFLSALQFGSKPRPTPQDRFVICQVPAYTEGEDHLRKGLDSLTALQYDNKRKLICVICDGMIVGGGNDRPTPKIVLDILGVDPKIDPPALPFKSVGQGNEQLNYGKVYSGLYEYEGNVVPYLVVVKVGKESEQTKSKPGNRGKRDSQILLMSFLNRVHHRAPMSPLELEMFHQINNIIGVDPELYEYVFMVDADTSVKEDALNRLVAACTNNAKIAGICGETSLENEERSWWTMIQVYEYYISHHLAKAFESLFGSVTCLPGCFCMYRLRTADKGKPLIISEKVIFEYSDCDVDTLHKKNLLSLGEDRFLTTIMTKHFPTMSFKFIPDAYALTAAPETWSILLSQRRRWINSTIHNLAELMLIKDMCGFCCFSMRFVVFIDLFGTLILPATCAYITYLIYKVATNTGQFPLISIIMIAAVYGLQALIFLLRRQWQHIGWMIIYIMAFPIFNLLLPVYAFWNQDNFSWGNTRIVIGEKGNKQIIALQDEGFDPRSIPLQRWDDYAAANNLPGRRAFVGGEKPYQDGFEEYEMDDVRSMYSSVKPASTILTGFPGQRAPYIPPRSPAPFGGVQNRQSTMSNLTRYADYPPGQERQMSMGNMSGRFTDNPYQQNRASMPPGARSTDNLMGMPSPPLRNTRSAMGFNSRPVSTVDFSRIANGPDDASIIEAIQTCLSEVDLDTVTKKQVRALVEQRLQTELTGERRVFLDRQIDAELANM
ncbi:MAG: hypothetical protein M1834_008641 [Cirrosporium novae-zelandiae]|nr:MAG: hypothetical protein M1834_008641 [Cirrosporium novae-zelandiae]